MPYPTPVINSILALMLHICDAFKGAVDNTVKGFFFEFLESCQSMKDTINASLYEKVIKEFSTITYICCCVCLTTCQSNEVKATFYYMNTYPCAKKQQRIKEFEKTHKLLYDLMTSYLGEGKNIEKIAYRHRYH